MRPIVILTLLLLTSIASALELPATDGKSYDPAAAGDKKAIVLFFVSPFCSTTKSFMKEINQITTDYSDRVVVYLIHPDPEVTLEVAMEHAILSEVKATVLLDKEQALAKQLHAKITPEVIGGVLASIGAAINYGFAATYTRMKAKDIPSVATAAGSQCAAALVLLPFAIPAVPHAIAFGTAQAWIAVFILGVVCTGVAYGLFFHLIATEGASKAVTVTFLVPATASVWAWLLLSEPITLGTVTGISIVLIATSMTLGLIKRPMFR